MATASPPGPCVSDTPGARWYGVVTRQAQPRGYDGFVGAIGNATATILKICNNGDAQNFDFNAVLPVNLQSLNGGIIQMGFSYRRDRGCHFVGVLVIAMCAIGLVTIAATDRDVKPAPERQGNTPPIDRNNPAFVDY